MSKISFNFSDAKLLDFSRPGLLTMVDMNSPAEVAEANALIKAGVIRVVGDHLEDDGPGYWTLVRPVEAGDPAAEQAPLGAFAHVG